MKSIQTHKRRRGQALIEMAISLIFLIVVLLGILEFGWLMRNNYILANASREGARAASVGRTINATETRIKNAAGTVRVEAPAGTIILQQSLTNGATWAMWPADVGTKNGVEIGALIRVTLRSNHRQLTGLFPFLNNRVIEQSTAIRREA